MATSERLPPGTSGLPLLGETLPFMKDMFGFIHERTKRHGPVFRSNILGTPTAFISGPEVCDRWLDENQVQREGSFPAPVQKLFGGAGVLPMLDGPAHRTRKQLVMAGFSREALASYLPGLSRTIESYLARWAGKGEFAVTPELKLLAIEGICGNVLGLGPGPELSQLVADYGRVILGFTGLPIQVPGTRFHAALQARDRVLAALAAQVKRHRDAAPGALPPDGLTRMLAARAPDGTALTPQQAALELHHVVLAGAIIFAELAALLVELHRHPDVGDRLRAEVRSVAATGEVTPAQLRQMPYLEQVIMEVKRTCPNVPVSFGKARAPITLGGFTIPAGWNVMMAVGEHNMNGVFTEPAKFDPERFSPARAEHQRSPHAFAPQGAGTVDKGHKCAGYDYSTVFMELFAVLLMRSYRWHVPDQDLSLDGSLIPPEVRSGLRIRVEPL
jgi:cytochrome P450